ncbi:MAG TPA: hypothetical protein DCL54_05100, partial [Alphaproteobacteria bacterium]|nr:hypothetical protein [Alphaproteobacteria bacterium]
MGHKHQRPATSTGAKSMAVCLRAALRTTTAALALLATQSVGAAITVQNGDTLNLNGATQSTDTLELIDGSVINGTLNASTAFNVRNGTISAFLSGSGLLTKSTGGVVTLASANNYTGTSQLFAGTLQLLSSASLGTGRVRTTFGVLDVSTGLNVLNEIELRNTGLAINVDAGTATWSGIISQETGVFGFEKTGAGNLRITNGSNTFAGPVKVSEGELTIAAMGGFQSSTELFNGAFLTFDISEGYTYNGVVSGTGRVSATGGQLILTAAQTLTNSTFTVNPGAGLILQSTATLGEGTNKVELRGGPDALTPALLDLGGTTQSIQRLDVSNVHNLVENGALIVSDEIAISEGTISANLAGAAGLTKDSSNNIVILSGANSYTGATVINGGTVIAQGGSAIGDASDVTIELDATLQLDFSETIGALAGAGAVDLQDNVLTVGRDGVDTTFSGLLAGTGALVKTGTGSLTLTGANTYEGGTTIEGGTLRVEDSLALGTGQIVTTGSVLDYADGINLANPITLDSNTTQLQVLTGSATQSGVISQDAGARPLEKIGAGTLIFTAANTYSGETTITAGTLRLAGAGQLFEGANVTVQSGATFDLTDRTQTLSTLTLNGNAIVTGEVFGDDPNAFLNVDTVAATTASGETAALDVAFASSGTVTKNGTGTLRIGGFPNFGFTGTVEHNAGTLQLIWGDALGSGTVNMNGDTILSLNNGTGNGQNFSNLINLAAAGAKIDVATNISVQHGDIFGTEGFEKAGFGLLGIAAPTSFTGLTKITEGGVQLREGLTGVYGSLTGPIEIGAAGYLDILRQDTALNLGGTISGAGGISTNGIFDFVSGTVIAGQWTLSGNNTYSGGTNVSAGTLRAGSATAFGTGFLNTNNSPLNAPGSIATISLNGFDISAAALLGNGVFDLTGNELTVNGSGGFVNGASFTAGTLTVADSANQSFGAVDLSPVQTLRVDGTVGLEGTGNVAPQAIVLGLNGRLDLEFLDQAEYVVTNIGGAGEIFLDNSLLTIDTPGSDVTLASLISGTGGSLKKTGAGVLELSGTNTFDGGIEVAQGTLRLANNAAAGTGVIRTTGSVIDYAAGASIGNHIVLDSNTTQLQVLTGIATQSGVIGESGGPRPLEKIGTGNLILTAANTYTGLTTVTDGRLQLGPGGSLAGNVHVGPSGNAWFDFNQSANYTYNGILSGGQVSLGATGAIIEWTGANTHSYTGIGDGTLLLSGAGTLGATTATVGLSGFTAAVLDLGGTTQTISTLNTFHEFGGNVFTNEVTNGTLNVNSVMNIESGTFSANLGGTGSLIKTTAGTATLSGTNTFTGPTTINAGTLVLQGGAALDDASDVVVNTSGTLQLNSSETIGSLAGSGNLILGAFTTLSSGNGNSSSTFSGVISGIGEFTKIGSGTITLSGANVHHHTNIDNGTVRLTAGGTLGDSSIVGVTMNGLGAGTTLDLGGTTQNILNLYIFGNTQQIVTGGSIIATALYNVESAEISANLGGTAGFLRTGAASSTILSGANSFSGVTTVDEGTLVLRNGAAIADSGQVVVESGATLQIDDAETLRSIASTGNVTLNSRLTLLNVSGEFGGSISGTSGLTTSHVAPFAAFTLSGVNTFSGQTTINGGKLILQNGSALADSNAVTVATGATLQLDASETIGSLAGSGAVTLGGTTLTTGGNDASTAFSGTFTGNSDSKLIKTGTGIFSVGHLGHSGETRVNAGALNFNGTAAGSVTVNSGGRLSGTHTINGDLINLGTLAPGNSPGTTTVLGNYTGGGVLEVEVQFDNASAPENGVTHDFLNIAGDVLGGPTTVSLLSFPPSFEPAATTGNGIEIIRVGGTTTDEDFAMTEYLFGDYFYNLAFVPAVIEGSNRFFLQSTLATPGCEVTTGNDACFIDSATDQTAAIDALAGNDTLQLTGPTDFSFDVSRIGTTYTNFEVFQKADVSTVTLTGTMADATQGIDVQNGTLIAGGGTLGANGRVNIFTPGTLQVASALTVGSIAGSGDIALGANTLTVGGDNTSTAFAGIISGSGDFEKQGSGIFTLSGANTLTGSLSLNDGGITVASGGTLGASTVDVFVQGTLDLGGTSQTVGSLGLASGAILNGALIVNGNAFAQVGTISADLTVTGSFDKAFGSGDLTLSGTNSFSSVGIGDGKLIAANDAAITDTASVNMSFIGFGIGPSLQILSDQTIGGLSGDPFSGLNLGAFNLTTGGNNASTSFDGVISSTTGKLVKTGAGVLTLSGNNIFSFAGGIDLLQGGLRLASDTAAGTGPITTFGSVIDYASGINNAAPVIINSNTTQVQVLAGSATQSGTISELGGPRPLEKIGAGALILSGSNTYTGATTITAGTLTAQGGSAIADTGAVSVAGDATFNLASSETIGALSGAGLVTLNANTLTAGSSFGNSTFSGVISGAGGLTKTGNSQLTLTGANTYTGLTTINDGQLAIGNGGTAGSIAGDVNVASGFLIFNRSDTLTFGGVLSGSNVAQIGTGVTILTGANTHASTSISAGTLRVQGTGTLGATNATVSIAGSFGPAILDLGGTTQTIGGFTLFQASNNTITNGTLIVNGGMNANEGSISANLQGTGPLFKGGAGVTTLSGTNTYTGATTVFDGTLILQGGSAIADAGVVTVTAPGTLQLANSETVGSLGASGAVVLGANTLTLGGNNASTAISGVISGIGGSLVKQGSGELVLSGANTFTGGTTIAGGTLELRGSMAAGTGAITTTGSTLRYGTDAMALANQVILDSNTTKLDVQVGSATQAGVISEANGPRGFEKTGGGLLILTADNTFTGTTTITSGGVSLGNGGTSGFVLGGIEIGAGANLAINRSDSIAMANGIAGAGSAFKRGAGTTTLSAQNTLNGAWIVEEGTLALGTNGRAGTSAVDVAVLGGIFDLGGSAQTVDQAVLDGGAINNGQLAFSGLRLGAGTIGASLVGAGQVVKDLPGLMILANANTYSGDTAVLSGTLQAGAAGAFSPNSRLVVGPNGLVDFGGFDATLPSLLGSGGLNIAGAQVTVGGDGASTLFSGTLTGAGGKLIKTGGGLLALSGNNTFDGGIDIMGGGISLGSNNAAGTGPIRTFATVIDYSNGVNNAAPIILASNDTQLQVLVGSAEQSGAISETGGLRPLEKIGAGNLTLSGTNTYTGLTTISGGQLTLSGGAAIADSADVDIASGATLRVAQSETIGALVGLGALQLDSGAVLNVGGDNTSFIYDGNTAGLGGLTKSGTGRLTMLGDYSASGALTLAQGQLAVHTGGDLANASSFSVASGATAFLGGQLLGVNGTGMTGTNLGALSVANTGRLYLDDNTALNA